MFAGQAACLSLFLQNVARQQLALGIGDGFKFGDDREAVILRQALDDAGAQQQAQSLWHQYQLERKVAARQAGLGMMKLDTALGQFYRLQFTDLAQYGLRDNLAEQLDAFVQGLEVAGKRAVTFADLAQQVLGLEFAQV